MGCGAHAQPSLHQVKGQQLMISGVQKALISG